MQQKFLPPFRQMRIDKIGSRFCKTNHIRGKKGSNDRYSHHYRIQKMTCYMQRHSQRSDDKSKFSNLRQTESALHSRLKRLPCKQYSQCAEQRLPDITANVMTTIGPAYSTIIKGSTIIPTDTKNMAPNKSFTGLTRRSILSASTVSARIDPMIKAPNAAEIPYGQQAQPYRNKARAIQSAKSPHSSASDIFQQNRNQIDADHKPQYKKE